MDNRDLNNRPDFTKEKNSGWKTVGILALSLALAVLTVLVINI